MRLRCVVRSMVPSTLSPKTASRWRFSGHSICSIEVSKVFMRAATDDQLMETFRNFGPRLLKLSKCPDLVVNRGHYFGTTQFNKQDGLSADEKSFGHEPELTDDDRRALIEFLKTF